MGLYWSYMDFRLGVCAHQGSSWSASLHHHARGFNQGVLHKLIITPGRRQSKMPLLSRNIDQKSIETVFLIAISRPTGDT